MKRLRHWLIASKKNKFRPKILEPISLAVIVFVLAGLPFIYNYSNGSSQVLGYATDISSGGLNSATNAQRASAGLSALNINGQLQQAAQSKAAHMFANQYWAHDAPDGTTPWSFISSSGYEYSVVGENLAKNFSTSSGVVNAWMNSDAHRANLLKSQYVDVGYGIQNGQLLGQDITLVVAMYGAPKNQTPAASTSEPTSSVSPVTQSSEPAPTASTPTETSPQSEVVAAEEVETTQESTATSAPVNTSSPEPVSSEILESIPAIKGIQSFAPVQSYLGLNWAQKTSLFIIASLAVLFIMKHTVSWRHQKRGAKNIWMRAHPLAQSTMLGIAVIILLMSGTGTIL